MTDIYAEPITALKRFGAAHANPTPWVELPTGIRVMSSWNHAHGWRYEAIDGRHGSIVRDRKRDNPMRAMRDAWALGVPHGVEPTARPILFSDRLVRAILDGRKWQTRRATGLDAVNADPDRWARRGLVVDSTDRKRIGAWAFDDHPAWVSTHARHRYGSPGDTLWVREAWGAIGYDDVTPRDIPTFSTVIHRATAPGYMDPWLRWRPSIQMPSWASRLTLRVLDVRPERLHDMTDADIVAEGVGDLSWSSERLRSEWRELWQSINTGTPADYDRNPWVWAIRFDVEVPRS